MITDVVATAREMADVIASLVNVKRFENMETMPWLLARGAVANTATKGALATSSFTPPTVECASFSINPSGPYANSYWYKELGVDPSKSKFTYELSFMFPSTQDALNAQAIEFEIQQVSTGLVFNMGWQFDFSSSMVRVFDFESTSWVSTGLVCPRWVSGQWMNLLVEMHRETGRVCFDAITINAIKHVLNISRPVATKSIKDMINCAIQLDSNANGDPYRVMVDRIRVVTS